MNTSDGARTNEAKRKEEGLERPKRNPSTDGSRLPTSRRGNVILTKKKALGLIAMGTVVVLVGAACGKSTPAAKKTAAGVAERTCIVGVSTRVRLPLTRLGEYSGMTPEQVFLEAAVVRRAHAPC